MFCNSLCRNNLPSPCSFIYNKEAFMEKPRRKPGITHKKTAGPFIALVILSLVFAACPGNKAKRPVYGSPPYTGSVSGEASDYHSGGPVKISVTLTLKDGYITAVSFDGSSGNTAGIGSLVIDDAPARIIANNSVEIDVMTGSSITSNAVIKAGKEALSKIPTE
jgi:uncharacterized protein with FMN-binding domain